MWPCRASGCRKLFDTKQRLEFHQMMHMQPENRYRYIVFMREIRNGKLFQVQDNQTTRIFVMKVREGPNAQICQQKGQRELGFLQQFRHHRGICQVIHGFFTTLPSGEGRFHIVMPHYPRTLALWIEDSKKEGRNERDVETTFRWIDELMDALMYIHDRGSLHRDVQPSNIFIDEERHLRIGDFSSATSGERIGPEVDFCALGVMLLDLITLETPTTRQKMSESQIDAVVPARLKMFRILASQLCEGRPTASQILENLKWMKAGFSSSSTSTVKYIFFSFVT